MVDWLKLAATIAAVLATMWAANAARKSNREANEQARARELKEAEQKLTDERIGQLSDNVTHIDKKLDGFIESNDRKMDSVNYELCQISKSVAVHEDRFQHRPPLSAVNK